MKKVALILVLSIHSAIHCLPVMADGNKIVKWKDSAGTTHYGDKLPSDEAGRSNTQLNNRGIIIKQTQKTDQKTQALDQQKEQEKLAQQRADKVLLASYTKPEEIDLACERNLQTDYAALQSLAQSKQNVLARVTHSDKAAQALKAKNMPLPASLSDELKQSQAELSRINKQIAQRNANIAATRQRYAEEKSRFITLKQPDLPAKEPAMAASLNVQ